MTKDIQVLSILKKTKSDSQKKKIRIKFNNDINIIIVENWKEFNRDSFLLELNEDI